MTDQVTLQTPFKDQGEKFGRSMSFNRDNISQKGNLELGFLRKNSRRAKSKDVPKKNESIFQIIGNAFRKTVFGQTQKEQQGQQKVLTQEEAKQLKIGRAAFQRTKLKLPLLSVKKDQFLERSQLNIEKTLKAVSKKELTLSLCKDINDEIEKEREEVYSKFKYEKNIIVVSWINDLGEAQPPGSDRILFFNNESLLLEQNAQRHFDMSNLKKLYENGIEVVCMKGENSEIFKIKPKFSDKVNQNTRLRTLLDTDTKGRKEGGDNGDQKLYRNMNQDNFFTIVDGNYKFIGVFDGHGEHGHLVSNAAMSIMLDYIRNRNDIFKSRSIHLCSQEQILTEIKKAFRYTQKVLLEDFQVLRDEHKKNKREAEKSKQDELNSKVAKSSIDSSQDIEQAEKVNQISKDNFQADRYLEEVRKQLKKLKTHNEKIQYLENEVMMLKQSLNVKEYIFKDTYSESDAEVEVAFETHKKTPEDWCIENIDLDCAFDDEGSKSVDNMDQDSKREKMLKKKRKESSRRRRLYSIRYGSKFVESSFIIEDNKSQDSNTLIQNIQKVQQYSIKNQDRRRNERICNEKEDKVFVQQFLLEQFERKINGQSEQQSHEDSDSETMTYKEKKKVVKELLKQKALRKKVQKYVYYKRQIAISECIQRKLTFSKNNQLRIINHKPEIRFRANRDSHWQMIARKLLKEDFDSFKRQKQSKREKKRTKREIKRALMNDKNGKSKFRNKIIQIDSVSQDKQEFISEMQSSESQKEGGQGDQMTPISQSAIAGSSPSQSIAYSIKKKIENSFKQKTDLHEQRQPSQDEKNFQSFDTVQEDLQSIENKELKFRSPLQNSLAHSPILKQSYKKNYQKQQTKKRPKELKGPTILKRLTESSSSSSTSFDQKSNDNLSDISQERDYLLNQSESNDSIHQEIEEQRMFEEQLILEQKAKNQEASGQKFNDYENQEFITYKADKKEGEVSINRQHLMTSEVKSSIESNNMVVQSSSSEFKSSSSSKSEGNSNNQDDKVRDVALEKNFQKKKRQRRMTEPMISAAQAAKLAKQEKRANKLQTEDLKMFASDQKMRKSRINPTIGQKKMNFTKYIKGNLHEQSQIEEVPQLTKKQSTLSEKEHQILNKEIEQNKRKIQQLQQIINQYKQNQNSDQFAFPNEDKVEQMRRIKAMEVRRRVKMRDEEEFKIDIGMSGTTATLVIIFDDMIYYGWVGNSLCCISSKLNGKQEKLPEVLTYPFHTPINTGEKIRIYNINKGEVRSNKNFKNTLSDHPLNRSQNPSFPETKPSNKQGTRATTTNPGPSTTAASGATTHDPVSHQKPREYLSQIKLFDPQSCPRVYVRGRNYPGIAVTRSLGDSIGHRLGVLSEPSRGCTQFGQQHNHDILVVASQGVWNVMTPKEVFSYIRRNQNLNYGLIGQKLAANIRDLQMDRDTREGGGQYHDITIVIVYLNQAIAKYK